MQAATNYATGRRKTAAARVFIKPEGNGEIFINGHPMQIYCKRETHRRLLTSIVESTGTKNVTVMVTVKGGGSSGQVGAIVHGLATAFQKYDPTLRPMMKKAGYLTRDAREVERKKYGHRKARKVKQYSKR